MTENVLRFEVRRVPPRHRVVAVGDDGSSGCLEYFVIKKIYSFIFCPTGTDDALRDQEIRARSAGSAAPAPTSARGNG